MKLAQIIRSNPVKRFRANIGHSTPRQLTALEWFLVAVAQLVHDKPEFADVSIADFLHKGRIFGVDSLVKRCIHNLMSVGVLENDSAIVAQKADLSQISTNALKITDIGRKAFQDEMIPGALCDDDVDVMLDVQSGEVAFYDEKASFDDRCTGINVCSDVNLEEVELPSLKVGELLQNEQLQKEPVVIWLTSESKIQKIADCTPLQQEYEFKYWINQPFILNITGNGVIEANMDDSKINMVLNNLSGNAKCTAAKCAPINFDNDVERVATPKDKNALMQKLMLNNSIFIGNRKLLSTPVMSANKTGGKDDDNKSKAIIEYGAEELVVSVDKNGMRVSLPSSTENDTLFGDVAFATENNQMNTNLFTISVGTNTRDMELSYVPKKHTFPTIEFVSKIVEDYGKEHKALLTLLILSRQTPRFYGAVRNLCVAETNVKDRVKVLREVVDSSRVLMGRTYLTPMQEAECLFDNWIPGELTTQQAYDLVKELDDESYIRNNAERLQQGFDQVIAHWNVRDDLDKFWNIVKIVSKTQGMQQHLNDKQVLASLYTDQFVDQLFAKFGQIPSDIKAFSLIERVMLELQKFYVKFCSKLSAVGYKADMRSDQKRVLAMNQNTAISGLNAIIKDLNACLKALSGCVKNLDNYKNQSYAHFFEMIMILDDVAKWIAPYLGADTSNYDKVYIVDTCALMNAPELVKKFENGRSALVVPKAVISELDGLKQSNDANTAKKARDAIRAIHNSLNENWCFTEQSHPELLPPDYPEYVKGERVNDNLILSVALHYWAHNPILITGDNNFKNKLMSEKISVVTIDKLRI